MADENKTERVQLLMTPSEVKAIDDWSFENRIRGRAEAMRRLCQVGLYLEKTTKHIIELLSKDKTQSDDRILTDFRGALLRSGIVLLMMRGFHPDEMGEESPSQLAEQMFEALADEETYEEVKRLIQVEVDKRKAEKSVE